MSQTGVGVEGPSGLMDKVPGGRSRNATQEGGL